MTKNTSLKEISLLVPDWPAPNCVVAAVSLRNGGVSQSPYDSLNTATHVGDSLACVTRNRALLAERLQLPCEPVWLNQVHGIDVVAAETVNGIVDADGSFSKQTNVVCVVQTADCLPVFLCNREGSQVAAVHAGWRGLVAGVLEQAVSTFEHHSPVIAWLGPAISQAFFEVGEEVRQAFVSAATDEDKAATTAAFRPSQREGHWYADLYQLARIRLKTVGVESIYGGQECCYGDSSRFFSYRRDGVTGRMASLIYIKG